MSTSSSKSRIKRSSHPSNQTRKHALHAPKESNKKARSPNSRYQERRTLENIQTQRALRLVIMSML
eukprot:3766731-Rhodomonas_salina.1